MYIPYPATIRKEHLDFFPPREQCFDVRLPSGKIISMKVCQDGGKAIMSNPNKALGEWILREVLRLDELELLTYDKLLELGGVALPQLLSSQACPRVIEAKIPVLEYSACAIGPNFSAHLAGVISLKSPVCVLPVKQSSLEP